MGSEWRARAARAPLSLPPSRFRILAHRRHFSSPASARILFASSCYPHRATFIFASAPPNARPSRPALAHSPRPSAALFMARACALRLLCAALLAAAAHGQFKHRGGKGPRKRELDFDAWESSHGARKKRSRSVSRRARARCARCAAATRRLLSLRRCPQATPFRARSASCAARVLRRRAPTLTRTMRAGACAAARRAHAARCTRAPRPRAPHRRHAGEEQFWLGTNQVCFRARAA